MCQNRQHKKWNGTHGYGALAYIGNHYHQYNKRRRLKSSFIVFNKVRPSVPWHKRISSTNRYHRRVRVQIHCVAVFEQWLIEILLRRFFFLLRLIICVCVCVSINLSARYNAYRIIPLTSITRTESTTLNTCAHFPRPILLRSTFHSLHSFPCSLSPDCSFSFGGSVD